MINRTALFNAIRAFAKDRRLQPDQVKLIDELSDSLGLTRISNDDWLPLSLTLVKRFEGCRLTAYPDPGSGGDPWTIGWGATGKGIAKGVTWSQADADYRLALDVSRFAAEVDKLLGASPATAYQKAALVSFSYNVGIGNLGGSTLLKKHKAGDYTGAAIEFAKWNKASGKVLNGLVTRRAAEAEMYRGKA